MWGQKEEPRFGMWDASIFSPCYLAADEILQVKLEFVLITVQYSDLACYVLSQLGRDFLASLKLS